MLARDLSDFLTLEEPTGPDALEAGTQLAKVLTLGASVLDLDPRAGQGIEFLTERIREAFTIPALSTNSKEALVALWSEVGASVLRRMDAIAELLHEAALASGSDAINQRLEHGDQAAISELALKFADERSSATGKRLRRTSVLISDARARLRELGKQIDDVDLRLLGAFRRAVLMWAVGIGLCFEIAERKSGLVEEDFRPGLLDDAVEIVTSSARLAGYYAATSAGLLVYADNPDDLRPLLTNDDAVAFLVHASRAIPNTFGPDVTARLEFFRYPDAPGESQYHVVIDSPLHRDQANERLDALCDDWWDTAAAGLGVDLFPVLGVID